jgi:heat shock protein HslJ
VDRPEPLQRTLLARALAAALLTLPLMIGCTPLTASSTATPMSTSASPAAPSPLDRTAWVLTALPGQPLPAGVRPTLRFEGERVGGNDGCNHFGGSWQSSGGTLRIGPRLAATLMACPPPATAVAAAFGRALTNTTAYRIESGALVLIDGNGQTLATLSAQPTGLAGTRWEVDGYNNGRQAVVSVTAGSRITLAFDEAGVSGSAGCNRFSGTYRLADEALTVGPLRTTRMTCAQPTGIMEQERAFLAALGSAAVVRREGDRLVLRTAAGAIALSARASSSP